MKLERIERRGGVFSLSWDMGVHVRVERIRTERNGDFRGQVTFYDGDVLIHQTMMNLSVGKARTEAAKVLATRNNKRQWPGIIEEMCFTVIQRLLRGSPVEEIRAEDDVPPEQHLVEPFLPLKQPSLLYGRGGSCKSYLGLLLAVCVELPWTDNPFGWGVPKKVTNTLILDWETDKNTVHRRLKRLLRGMGLPAGLHLPYRHCHAPLVDEIEAVERILMEKKIEFVIVDSAGKACGGDLIDAGAVNAFYSAISQMGVTCLIIHHLAKDEFTKRKTPFGSAYFENNARSQWHIEREQGDETDFALSLSHTKVNDSAKHQAIGLRVRFENTPGNEATAFELCDLKETEFADRLPLRQQIEALLLERGLLSAPDIANQVGKPANMVRAILSRNKGLFTKVDQRWGVLSGRA